VHGSAEEPEPVRCTVPFGPAATDTSATSRTFLLRVAAVLGFIIAAVGFTTWRGDSGTVATESVSTGIVPTSSLDIANLAPSTSAAPTASNAEGAPVPTLADNALPELGLATPQSAARNLWDAWRDRDRPRALLYANPSAVDRLFDSTWVPQIRQAGCTPIESGWLCRFEGPKQRWDTSIDGNPQSGYRVVGLRIGDPVGDLLAPNSLPAVTNLTPITGPDGTPTKLGPPVPPVGEVTTSIPITNPDGTPAVPAAGGSTSVGPGISNTSETGTSKDTKPASSKPKRPRTTTNSKPRRSTTAADQPADSPDTPATPDTQPERAPEPPREPEPAAPAAPDNGPVPVEGGTTPLPN
jgi:hypothetical protein